MMSRSSLNSTYDGQQDVDEEVSSATSLEEDSEWRKDESEDDLADVSVILLVLTKNALSAHCFQSG